jgi:flagellar biosynthesis/type III secretory pathway chaperone
MESSPAVFESLSHTGVLPIEDSPFHSECLATALELLEVLREEAEILTRFAGAELLALIPKKEYLVNELEWKLESARHAGEGSFTVPDPFKALLGEIVRLNTSNGVFIEKTLSYWQDFLAIFSPPSYGPTGKKARRPARPPKGITFTREV